MWPRQFPATYMFGLFNIGIFYAYDIFMSSWYQFILFPKSNFLTEMVSPSFTVFVKKKVFRLWFFYITIYGIRKSDIHI